MGKLSRNKGKVFEREVAAVFRRIYGDKVKRGWQAREGFDAPDVENVPGLWVEAKHHARVSVRAALEQAEEARRAAEKDGLVPIAVCKDNRTDPLVALYFDDFIAMLVELEEARAKNREARAPGASPSADVSKVG